MLLGEVGDGDGETGTGKQEERCIREVRNKEANGWMERSQRESRLCWAPGLRASPEAGVWALPLLSASVGTAGLLQEIAWEPASLSSPSGTCLGISSSTQGECSFMTYQNA